jgi:hypothetical protein
VGKGAFVELSLDYEILLQYSIPWPAVYLSLSINTICSALNLFFAMLDPLSVAIVYLTYWHSLRGSGQLPPLIPICLICSERVQVLVERWKVEYNTVRPHSSLNYQPPALEAIKPEWLENAVVLS